MLDVSTLPQYGRGRLRVVMSADAGGVGQRDAAGQAVVGGAVLIEGSNLNPKP